MLNKMAQFIPEDLVSRVVVSKGVPATADTPLDQAIARIGSYMVEFDEDGIIEVAQIIQEVDMKLHGGTCEASYLPQVDKASDVLGRLSIVASKAPNVAIVTDLILAQPPAQVLREIHKPALNGYAAQDDLDDELYFVFKVIEALKVAIWITRKKPGMVAFLEPRVLLLSAMAHVYPPAAATRPDLDSRIPLTALIRHFYLAYAAAAQSNLMQYDFPKSCLRSDSRVSDELYNQMGISPLDYYRSSVRDIQWVKSAIYISLGVGLCRAYRLAVHALEKAEDLEVVIRSQLVDSIEIDSVAPQSSTLGVTMRYEIIEKPPKSPTSLPETLHVLVFQAGQSVKRRQPFYITSDGVNLTMLTPTDIKVSQYLLKAYDVPENDYLIPFHDDIVAACMYSMEIYIGTGSRFVSVRTHESIPSLVDIRSVLNPDTPPEGEPSPLDIFKATWISPMTHHHTQQWVDYVFNLAVA